MNKDYYWSQKLPLMLGYDYQLAMNLEYLPKDAKLLIVSPATVPYQFINYYILPKSLYVYPKCDNSIVSNENEINKVPSEWMREKGINYIIVYNPPSVKILDVNKSGEKKR